MAILVIAELPGATREVYDSVNEHLGISGEDTAPDGLVQHVAAETEDGITIIDVWESEQAFRSFIASAGEAMQDSGVPPFEPRVLPVHNTLEGSGTEANVVMIAEIAGIGPDEYDRMTSTMDAHAGDGSKHPSVSHTIAVTDSGLLAVDVWDSPESFGRFAEAQIGPAAETVGMGPIEPRFLPVYNRVRGKARASV